MTQEHDTFNRFTHPLPGPLGSKGSDTPFQSAAVQEANGTGRENKQRQPTSPGSGRLYMGKPSYDSSTLRARLKDRIDAISQPQTEKSRNPEYLGNMGQSLIQTAGGDGGPLPGLYSETTYSQDDLIAPIATSAWNKTTTAGNGGQGAPLDPGYLQAKFSMNDISDPVKKTWNHSLDEAEPTLACLGRTLEDRYAHAPDNNPAYGQALAEVDWDTPGHRRFRDLGIASQASRYRVAGTAARMAADMATPMNSPDTIMLTAANDYRHAPEKQTGEAWADSRQPDFLPQLVENSTGVLKAERERLESLHSQDYQGRSLFDPEHNILTSPSALAGRVLEDVVPGVATVAGLTQAMGGGSTSYLAQLGAPFIAEAVDTYYAEREKFHDNIMRCPEDRLVREHPEYAALLGHYQNETEARQALIRQKAHTHAYDEAVRSILVGVGAKRFLRSVRTGDESKKILRTQEGLKEVVLKGPNWKDNK